MSTEQAPSLSRCSLPRRLAVIFYDALLLGAVLLLASAVSLIPTGGNAIQGNQPLMLSYFLIVSFGYYAIFWTRSGQTLAMKTWSVRLQSLNGGRVTLTQALLRFIVAMASWGFFGLGFLWSLFDKDKLTWHDRYSMTELVVVPKKK